MHTFPIFGHISHCKSIKVWAAAFFALLLPNHILAQQSGQTGYEFLNIPTSAHSAALGGNVVSLVEDDATLLFSNPALLANVSDRTLGFGYMSYMSSSTKLSADFVRATGERGTWAVAAQVLSYGKMTRTDADQIESGTFSASDIALQGGYTYLLSDYWSGGAQGKVLMSSYGDYSSTALAVDLGLNYYDEERGFSFGLVAQNLGGEIDALYERSRKLPFNLVMGISKELANAPVRLSLTLSDLTHWSESYYQMAGEKMSGSNRFWNHIAFGADIFPSSSTWLAIGYNFRRGYEMKVVDKSHGAGWSFGGGLAIKRFKLGVAYGKYHVSSSSLTVNAAYSL